MPMASTRPTSSTPASPIIAPRIGIAALAPLPALLAFAAFIERCA
jgi:hypothetical protein